MLMAVLLGTIPSVLLNAQIGYGFLNGTGSRITGAFTAVQNGSQAGAGQSVGINPPSADLIPIGFTFNFDGTDYTNVYVSSNGFLSFGGTYGNPGTNGLNNIGANVLAPFWDQLRVPGGFNACGNLGRVQYLVSGTAPNRVLVVDFENLSLGDGFTLYAYAPVTFQVRLYESSGAIEFYYENMSATRPSCVSNGATTAATTGSIGITSSNGFISVTPAGSSATSSTVTANNTVNLSSATITSGSLYTFCKANITGNTASGGTAAMANGDSLLVDEAVVLNSSRAYQPFTLFSPCSSTFTYTITGPQAAEYSISPATGPMPAIGSVPTLTFQPTALGTRHATLNVTDGLGIVVRSYPLAGRGIPRISWIGNIADGGVTGAPDGAVLMTNVAVDNGTSGNFSPITISVAAGAGPNAPVTYTLIDLTGQFAIDRTSESVPAGSSSSPVITFTPTGIGPQEATLIVNAEGEIRTYTLRPFARGAGARFYIGSAPLGPGSPVFQNTHSCVGVQVQTVEIRVESIGDLPFFLQTSDVFFTDNVIRQGTPPFELLRDNFGNPLPSQDYFISATPNSTTPISLPFRVDPGESKNIYLNFLPTRPEKRRARAFFETNGLNFFGLDTDNNTVAGILNFELVGDGLGSSMADKEGDDLPQAVVFSPTEVRGTKTLTGYIRNNGDCDLFINADAFRLVSGDVNEFKIETGLQSPIDGQGNFVLPPGALDSFVVSFTPQRSGSRRASIRLITNDSSVVLQGVSERGTRYIDVFGVGKVGIEVRRVNLPPGVINGPSSRGHAVLENTAAELVTITGITVVDPNGEIVEDPARMWPALPLRIEPGTRVNLGLQFTPTPGSTPGERNATLELTLSNGDVVTVDIRGVAGTRELAIASLNLFQGMQLPIGDLSRQFLIVTNQGTLPVAVQELKLTEANPGDYQVSGLERNILEPGQTEFYQVSWTPQVAGPSSGTIEIVSNATNGPHIVTLGGEGTSIARGDDGVGASASTLPQTGDALVRPSGAAANLHLYSVLPNPVADLATVRFTLPTDGVITVGIYDETGRLVRSVMDGEHSAGTHSVQMDLDMLSSGYYYLRLLSNGHVLTRPLTVVR